MKGFAISRGLSRFCAVERRMLDLLEVLLGVGSLVETAGSAKRSVTVTASETFADAMQHFGMPDSGVYEHRGVRIVAGYKGTEASCVSSVRAILDPPLDLGLAFTSHPTAAHSASGDEPPRLDAFFRPKLRASLDAASRRWSVSISDTHVLLAEPAIPSISFYAEAMPFAAKLVVRLRNAAERTSCARPLEELAREYKALAAERGVERTKTPLGLVCADGTKLFAVRTKPNTFAARAEKRMDLAGSKVAFVKGDREMDVTSETTTTRRPISESTRALLDSLRTFGVSSIDESTLRVELPSAPSATDALRVLDATRATADALQAEIVPSPKRAAYR